MERFVKIANVRDIEPGTSEFVQIKDVGIAIFNTGGAFYAVEDYCTGDGGSLSEGTLMGTMVECPSDRARFYLPTGECVDQRSLKRLATYPIRIDGDEVKIDLRAAARIARNARRPLAVDQLWSA